MMEVDLGGGAVRMLDYVARVFTGRLPAPTNRRQRIMWRITWQPHGWKDRVLSGALTGTLTGWGTAIILILTCD